MKFVYQTIKALVLTVGLVLKWVVIVAFLLSAVFFPTILAGLLIDLDAARLAFLAELILFTLFILSTLIYGDWEKTYMPGEIFARERFCGWKFNKKS